MTYEEALNLIKEAREKNLTEINLSYMNLTQLPPEIGELENLITLNLFSNKLNQLTPEIAKLKNLTILDLTSNKLTPLPSEIGELKNLTTLELAGNHLTQLPPEIGKLKNLTSLNLSYNRLTQLPPEIGELKKLTSLNLTYNRLTQLPLEIGKLKNLTSLNLYHNSITQLPQEIGELKNLILLDLSCNRLTQLPPEIGEVKNLNSLNIYLNSLTQLPSEIGKLKKLIELNLSNNELTQLPWEIGKLEKLIELNLSNNELTQLPWEIGKLEKLIELNLSHNKLTQLPLEIRILEKLTYLNLSGNPLISPPPEIASMGLVAVFTYLKQTKTTEHNEAKLILVGNGEVGKTCLAHRLINDTFLKEAMITEGINISKWEIPAPCSVNSEIKLNIWDFGGQEIYHATHQFFLTTRSVYLLIWNARKTKDYDHIYYWLHTIEAFGGDSPIILVMSKMNESNDDLNLKDLSNKFPQIVDYLKIDSKDGKGISALKEKIKETAWNLPLMKVLWVDSWYKIREKLERLGKNWISDDEFHEICVLEGLDNENINTLEGYLHELGVILHFKDKLTLKNIVILKPEWATGAFYKILSTKSVLDNEGVLLQSELSKIWDVETYPSSIYPQIMDLMNKFELAYELPDKESYLIPELLPKVEPNNFKWDDTDNLCFYYCYDYFLPTSIITRFIVRMHQNIEKRENGLPFCWREGVVLKLEDSLALVKMKPDEKQIEIRVKGDKKREVLVVIRYHLDHINNSIKKIKVSKRVPCNCSENCPERYPYELLLKAEMNNSPIQCHEHLILISVSSLLDGYKKREERFREYDEIISRQLGQPFIFSPKIMTNFEANPTINVEQKTKVNTNIIVNLKVDLPQIQNDFANLRRELKNKNNELDSELEEIQDSLDEVSADSEIEKLKKPFNKLGRFLKSLGDPTSDYYKIVTGTEKGTKLVKTVAESFNKIVPLLGILAVHGLH